MSERKRNVPKLRFPGFTEDWEQRKLGEVAQKCLRKNQNLEYKETFTNSAEYGIVSQMHYFDKAISNIDNINGYYIVHPNDFVYNPRISVKAPVGPISRNKLERIGVMSPLYTVFSFKDDRLLQFYEKYFESNVWHKYIKLSGDSGVRSDRISIKDTVFFDMPIMVPNDEEEAVIIGKTLEAVSIYITLHQRNYRYIILIRSL